MVLAKVIMTLAVIGIIYLAIIIIQDNDDDFNGGMSFI